MKVLRVGVLVWKVLRVGVLVWKVLRGKVLRVVGVGVELVA